MTQFRDLDLIHYHNGPCDAEQWQCPLLAVGWLERGDPYTTGECSPLFVEKLNELREQFKSSFPEFSFRGLHVCSVCESDNGGLRDSHVNFFIPGKKSIYLAPGRIDHYIHDHAYLPPQEFLEAVLSCPDPRSAPYSAKLNELNHGKRPPLFPERWNVIRVEGDDTRIVHFEVDNETKGLEFARMFSLRNPGQKFEVEKAPDRFSR